ncbi:MAG: SUMF1/EgtB/PvdO family nonheme iron enzyme [Kiritimatiellae bacterium]|nr:SUMF1/EgtB/PvdO family nonheme iron enzyme [Kiritimatiellia bacterium]
MTGLSGEGRRGGVQLASWRSKFRFNGGGSKMATKGKGMNMITKLIKLLFMRNEESHQERVGKHGNHVCRDDIHEQYFPCIANAKQTIRSISTDEVVSVSKLSSKTFKRVKEKNFVAGAKRAISVCGVSFNLRWIPGNEEQFGFWMCETPVTQELWTAIMGSNPSAFKGNSKRPVECVSWNDCQQFLGKINATSCELKFRLPTETEWEYASHAGSNGLFCRLSDGSEINETNLDRVAWFYTDLTTRYNQETHPVATKEPNAWGLFDMFGNVEEWTQDAKDKRRFYRGGGVFSSVYQCSVAGRDAADPDKSRRDSGFRLVADEISRQTIPSIKMNTRLSEVNPKKSLVAGTKRTIIVCGVPFNMRWIPENGMQRGFWMGETPVTDELWRVIMKTSKKPYISGMAFIAAGFKPLSDWSKMPSFYGVKLNGITAAYGISFLECQAFISKLNKQVECLSFRLPSEEEWKFARHAGDTKAFCLADGTKIFKNGLDRIDRSSDQSRLVAQTIPNAWGLYDMFGFLEEWTQSIPPPTHFFGEQKQRYEDFRVVCGNDTSQIKAMGCEFAHNVYKDLDGDVLGFRLAADEIGRQ